MKDSDKQFAEIRAILAEVAASHKEAAAEREKSAAEFKAEREKSAAEFDRRLAEEQAAREKAEAKFNRQIDAINEQHGGFTRTAGESLEDEFYLALDEDKRIGDIVLHEVYPHAGVRYDFDVAAKNSEFAFAGEIKNRLSATDVIHFAEKRLPLFAADCVSLVEGRKVLGMVGGKVIEKRAREEAEKRGLIVLRLKNKKLIAENADKARPIAQR